MSDCARCGKGINHLDHSRGVCAFVKLAKEPKPVKPLAQRSQRMAEFYREERIPLVQLVMARAGGRCEVLSPWHERESDWNPVDAHEIATRGREGGIMADGVNTPENCVAACRRCHQAITDNPDWAESAGWLKPASATREEAI